MQREPTVLTAGEVSRLSRTLRLYGMTKWMADGGVELAIKAARAYVDLMTAQEDGEDLLP